MQKIVIFGNSGSGKSTLAKKYVDKYALAHLDLDSIAWAKSATPTRRPLTESQTDIEQYLADNTRWVVEGCYADLLGIVLPHASKVIFINPGIDTCIENCRNRPWELHKYASPEAQDKNLAMLIDWVKQYPQRSDEFSLAAHRQLFDDYQGNKTEYKTNHTGHI